MSGTLDGNAPLPGEFDEVTSEIVYPQITKKTTEKEFVRKAGNGYLMWVVGFGILGGAGFVLFIWGVWEISKWL